MDKQVLSEINRSREIMGLGQLIREEVNSDSIKIWLSGDGSDKSGTVKEFMGMVNKHFANQTIDGDTFWVALNKAFEQMTGRDIVKKNGEGTNAAFAPSQFKSYDQTKPGSPLIKLGDGTVRVTSTELQLDKDTPIELHELIDKINKFNIDNAGDEQLVYPSDKKLYKAQGNSTRILSKNGQNNRLYLWSISDTEQVRNVTDDKIIPGKDIAGEVLNAPLSDSYDNLVINIKDTSKSDDIKAQMEAHVEQGGTVDSVTITSTASNTGLDPKKMSDFSNMMDKAGFSEYSNVSPKAGGEMEFTMKDKIDTTDKALAVARGKLLAKLLGVEDKAVYKFAITSEAKVVNVSVKGTSPATPGEDETIKGDIEDYSVDTERGKMSKVKPFIMNTYIGKRNIINKVGDFLGTSGTSQRRKKA